MLTIENQNKLLYHTIEVKGEYYQIENIIFSQKCYKISLREPFKGKDTIILLHRNSIYKHNTKGLYYKLEEQVSGKYSYISIINLKSVEEFKKDIQFILGLS
jgi:hypothetical protein